MLEKDYFNTVFCLLKDKRMGEAIRALRELMEKNRAIVADDTFHTIAADHDRMLDYMEQGYDDPQREEIYQRLVRRLWFFTRSALMTWLCTSKSMFREARQKSGQQQFTPDDIERTLHNFVSDVAMLSLETDEAKLQKEADLYARHLNYVSTLFNHIFVSNTWSKATGAFYTRLLLSPMTDSIDARMLVSAITLNCLIQFDMEKLRTLIDIHQQTADPELRERALVGWFLSLPHFQPSLFPEFTPTLRDVCTRHAAELLELQQQVIACINTDRDNETLQNDIMPNLMKNSGFKLTQRGIEENEDPMEDILDPDAADKRMEEAEKNINKILDMQKQGADIYFGSFKLMKRFSFFYTLSNWFTPFFMQHPGLSHLTKDLLSNKFVLSIINKGPFCESDKYSFALGASSVISHLPQDVLKMVENIEDIDPAMKPDLINTPIFRRQVYLQDLYRFFKLHPQHSELPFDPFHVGSLPANDNYFILDNDLFADIDDEHILLMRARYHHKVRRYGVATKELYDLVEKYPDNVQARAMLAHSLLELGSYAQAADHYEQLLVVRPDNFKYKLNYAHALTESGQYEDAMETIFRLSYEYPDDMRVTRLLAWAHLIQRHAKKAEPCYDKLLASAEANYSDKLNAAYCYWFTGRMKQAVGLFREYVEKKDTPLDVAFVSDEELLGVYEVSEFDKQLLKELVERQPRDL